MHGEPFTHAVNVALHSRISLDFVHSTKTKLIEFLQYSDYNWYWYAQQLSL